MTLAILSRVLVHDRDGVVPRDATLARYYAVALCLSVSLSLTSRSSTKTAEHRITSFTEVINVIVTNATVVNKLNIKQSA